MTIAPQEALDRMESQSDADKIILYQFPRDPDKVSLSSFCIKAETLLRVAGAPYRNVFLQSPKHTKGKLPVYEWRGELFEDSQLGYEELVRRGAFGASVDEGLTDTQRAIGQCVRQTIESHAYPILVFERFQYEWETVRAELLKGVPGIISIFVGYFIRSKITSALVSHGIGRYSETELFDTLLPADLAAVSTILGANTWVTGARNPSTADAALFGFIAGAVGAGKYSPRTKKEVRRHANLVQYYERVRKLYWPEWITLSEE
ncbi:hypothetical protein HDU93_000956 [Gonapodya sp. JEL0774]|nr:hypothetical protein HDU93_000956 [Gonapodya sp. JEL0774]